MRSLWRRPLTAAQVEALRFVVAFHDERGRGPTVIEMAAALGTSDSVARDRAKGLARRYLVRLDYVHHRNIPGSCVAGHTYRMVVTVPEPWFARVAAAAG